MQTTQTLEGRIKLWPRGRKASKGLAYTLAISDSGNGMISEYLRRVHGTVA